MSFSTTASVKQTINNCNNGCVSCFYHLVEDGNKLYITPDYSLISENVRAALNPEEDKILVYDADTGMFYLPTVSTDMAVDRAICVLGDPTLVPWDANNSTKKYNLSISIKVYLEMYRAKKQLIEAVQSYNETTWRI